MGSPSYRQTTVSLINHFYTGFTYALTKNNSLHFVKTTRFKIQKTTYIRYIFVYSPIYSNYIY